MTNRRMMARRVSGVILTLAIAVGPSACAGDERDVLDRDALSLVNDLREVDGVLEASVFIIETNGASAKVEVRLENDLSTDELIETSRAMRAVILESSGYGERFGEDSSLEMRYNRTIEAPQGDYLLWGSMPSEATIEDDVRIWQEFAKVSDTVYLYYRNAGGFSVSVYPAVDENGVVLTEEQLRELLLVPWLAAGNAEDELEVKVFES